MAVELTPEQTERRQTPIIDILVKHLQLPPLPDGEHYGWRVCHPDLRSSHNYRWPFPGAEAVADPQGQEFTHGDPCPQFVGDGLCIALTYAGAASGGISSPTTLIVRYASADVLGRDSAKLRLSRASVVDVVDGWRIIRDGAMYGADLREADLRRANLGGVISPPADARERGAIVE